MADLKYNFLGDTFNVYENVDPPKILRTDLGDFNVGNNLQVNNGKVYAAPNQFEKENSSPQLVDHNNPEEELVILPESSYQVKYNLTGNKKKAMEFFQSKGLSAHAAAGIVGNLLQESKLNTKAVGDGGKALGIAQWHPDRQKGLKELAKKRGTDIYDLNTQLEYVWQELNGNYKSSLEGLLKSRNLDEATTIFMRGYERPSEKYANLKARIQFGQSVLS